MQYDDEFAYGEKEPSRSTAAKVGIGCAVTAVVLVLLTCISGVALAWWAFDKLDEFAQPYVEAGYLEVFSQTINVTQPVHQETLYTGQQVVIDAPVYADIAVFAQMLDIKDRVEGNVDAFAQRVVIHEGAVITGNFNAKAVQLLDIRGRVEGEVTGSVQTLRRRGTAAEPPTPAEPPQQETEGAGESDDANAAGEAQEPG